MLLSNRPPWSCGELQLQLRLRLCSGFIGVAEPQMQFCWEHLVPNRDDRAHIDLKANRCACPCLEAHLGEVEQLALWQRWERHGRAAVEPRK
eukprot:1319457-Prymnesium_polylepis.2